jgi:D-alanine transaminase
MAAVTASDLPLASWNGTLMPLHAVMVPALDRAFLFGDAVYEVVRLYGGEPFLLEPHERRLVRSLAEMKIDRPFAGGELAREIARLVGASGVGDGIFYLQVTRGAGPRKHVPPVGLTPNVLAYVDAFDEVATYFDGWRNGTSAALLPDERWARCDIKSVNLLGNVLAAAEAKARGAAEAILVDDDGLVTEGSHMTVFAVLDGALVTRPLSKRLLPSITREHVIALARSLGLTVREAPVTAASLTTSLAASTEVFVSATSSEVLPVTSIDGRRLGGGIPGPVTRRLQAAFTASLPRFVQDRRRGLLAAP